MPMLQVWRGASCTRAPEGSSVWLDRDLQRSSQICQTCSKPWMLPYLCPASALSSSAGKTFSPFLPSCGLSLQNLSHLLKQWDWGKHGRETFKLAPPLLYSYSIDWQNLEAGSFILLAPFWSASCTHAGWPHRKGGHHCGCQVWGERCWTQWQGQPALHRNRWRHQQLWRHPASPHARDWAGQELFLLHCSISSPSSARWVPQLFQLILFEKPLHARIDLLQSVANMLPFVVIIIRGDCISACRGWVMLQAQMSGSASPPTSCQWVEACSPQFMSSLLVATLQMTCACICRLSTIQTKELVFWIKSKREAYPEPVRKVATTLYIFALCWNSYWKSFSMLWCQSIY